jgi:predicted LPLAT superfamily acyltransferase
VLASLLEAPVYFVFAIRRGDFSIKGEYDMLVHKSPLDFSGSSLKEKKKNAKLLAASFVELLEEYARKYPYQWYNFYDYWEK